MGLDAKQRKLGAHKKDEERHTSVNKLVLELNLFLRLFDLQEERENHREHALRRVATLEGPETIL